MSQFGTFDIKASPSALSLPPEVEASGFDITAGGPEPGFYQMRLQLAEAVPVRVREDEHEYLDEIFRDLVSYMTVDSFTTPSGMKVDWSGRLFLG